MPGNGSNQMPLVQRINITPTTLVGEVQKLKIGGNNLPTDGVLSMKYGTSNCDDVNWDSSSASWKCSDIFNVLSKLNLGNFLCELTRDTAALYYWNIYF